MPWVVGGGRGALAQCSCLRRGWGRGTLAQCACQWRFLSKTFRINLPNLASLHANDTEKKLLLRAALYLTQDVCHGPAMTGQFLSPLSLFPSLPLYLSLPCYKGRGYTSLQSAHLPSITSSISTVYLPRSAHSYFAGSLPLLRGNVDWLEVLDRCAFF